jgi:Na+/melibiose symporter-like transporter
VSRFKSYLTTFILASLAGVIYYFVVFPILFWFYDLVNCNVASIPDCSTKSNLKTLIQSYPTNFSDIFVLLLMFLPPAILSFGVTAVGIKGNRRKGKSIQNILIFFLIVTFLFHIIPLVLLSGDPAFSPI